MTSQIFSRKKLLTALKSHNNTLMRGVTLKLLAAPLVAGLLAAAAAVLFCDNITLLFNN